MSKKISLIDMKRNEIASIFIDKNNQLAIDVPAESLHLKSDMQRLLAFIKDKGTLFVRKSAEENGVIIQKRESVLPGSEGYLLAVAELINKSKLNPPRVFAVLKGTGGED